jgi:glycolate oxidase FAD binding subunit
MSSIAAKLETLVSTDAVIRWEDISDPVWRSQIARAVQPDSPIECLVYPKTQAELAEVIVCAAANRWRILVCGSGSKLHWGGLAAGVQVVLSTAHLDRLIEHATGDLTVTAEAGMRVADLQSSLAQAGQFLAIDPTYAKSATLGGVVATADTGCLRQRYGSVRDMLIGISIVRTDGQVAKAGGRVVKNVAGYDLMKLFTGSYGTLGAIGQVTFRIYPVPPASHTIGLTGAVEQIGAVTATLLASELSPVAIELLAPVTATGLGLGQGMGLLVRFQSITVSAEQQAAQLLEIGQTLDLHPTDWTAANESDLWQRLREPMDCYSQDPQITCKIGVFPSKAAALLHQVTTLTAELKMGSIHASSGLGVLQFSTSLPTPVLMQIRELCQSLGGFLTILEAPLELKQTLDVWGYAGNGLELMQKLKQQFDPENLFSPQRFVGGI